MEYTLHLKVTDNRYGGDPKIIHLMKVIELQNTILVPGVELAGQAPNHLKVERVILHSDPKRGTVVTCETIRANDPQGRAKYLETVHDWVAYDHTEPGEPYQDSPPKSPEPSKFKAGDADAFHAFLYPEHVFRPEDTENKPVRLAIREMPEWTKPNKDLEELAHTVAAIFARSHLGVRYTRTDGQTGILVEMWAGAVKDSAVKDSLKLEWPELMLTKEPEYAFSIDGVGGLVEVSVEGQPSIYVRPYGRDVYLAAWALFREKNEHA